MQPATRRLWEEQDRHPGDRKRLFSTVRDAIGGDTVLYPGSFVDLAPSFVYPSVTYVDTDRRALSFFTDREGIAAIITANGGRPDAAVRFLHADYREDLGLAPGSVDLLVSLYAGFVSEHCTEYLRVGGFLLANPSHGDVAMASLDSRYELGGAVTSKSGNYRVHVDRLDQYLVPKSGNPMTRSMVGERGRGVAYTKTAFAYLFRRVG